MVIKGGARGGAGSLAAHLQNIETNERAELVEVRGTVADDLDGALQEMEAVASGTRSKRHFYHASINTDPTERLTPEQQAVAIDRLEEKLGLTGQPRAVVEHEKEGRAHVHVVWSRIDLENMRAISDSHNYRKHEEVARELETEFGHKRVQGAHIGRDGNERPERTPSHAEMQQAERTGLTPKEAKEQITGIWQTTDNGKAFAAALEQSGWTLARGDKRDFVLIDEHGETHSLARRIDGAKAKDVRERMADMDAASLPTVDEAREQQRARQVARDELRDAAARTQPPQQQEPEQGLPVALSSAPRWDEQPEIPLAATPEPDAIAPAIVADELILEPDLSRDTAASGGNVAAQEIAAPSALEAEAAELVASGSADGVQATDHDGRADSAAPGADASADIEPPSIGVPSADLDLAGVLGKGAGRILDAGATLAEGVISAFDGLIGGGSAKPKRATIAPPLTMTAKERHAVRLQAFRDADQKNRAVRQEKARSLGASDALTDEELRREEETQQKRSQDRGQSR